MYGFFCFVVTAIVGCSTPLLVPSLAERYHLSEQVILGKPFVHQLFINKAANTHQGELKKALHVYIDGDGSPFLNSRDVSLDPTSVDPMMLKLMSIDLAPSIYVGRPCYFSTDDSECSYLWWTHQRYHEQVVDSMVNVIRQIQRQFDGVILMGFSGGGALAMLIAEKLEDTKMVITLAGNLDTARWEKFHRYTPMKGSINPASRKPLAAKIRQVHFSGSEDVNVLPAWIKKVALKQVNVQFHLLNDIDHNCCWQELWPDMLKSYGLEDPKNEKKELLSE